MYIYIYRHYGSMSNHGIVYHTKTQQIRRLKIWVCLGQHAVHLVLTRWDTSRNYDDDGNHCSLCQAAHSFLTVEDLQDISVHINVSALHGVL